MRILVDLPDKHVAALNRLAESEGQSRAAIIRKAVGVYVQDAGFKDSDDGFGLWCQSEDGLALQYRMRAEW